MIMRHAQRLHSHAGMLGVGGRVPHAIATTECLKESGPITVEGVEKGADQNEPVA